MATQEPRTPEEMYELLNAPFHPEDVEWRPGSVSKDKSKAQAFAYVDARAVRRRLNDVCGIDGWTCDHYAIGDTQVGCRISIRFDRTVGDRVVTEWVSKTDGCWVGNVEPVRANGGKLDKKEEQRVDKDAKAALSIALKRAAVAWGVGSYLYDAPSPWLPVDVRNDFVQGFTAESKQRLHQITQRIYDDYLRAKKQAAPPRPRLLDDESAPASPQAAPSQPVQQAAPPPAQQAAPAARAEGGRGRAAPNGGGQRPAPADPAGKAAPRSKYPTDEAGLYKLRTEWINAIKSAASEDSLTSIGKVIAGGPFPEGSEARAEFTREYKLAKERLGIPAKQSGSTPAGATRH
jgi:hypothetical protein